MFSKTLIVSAVVLAFSIQVNAHAGVSPALGVKGNLQRSDVQQPSTSKPCGSADLAAIDTTTPVLAAPDGSMTVTIQNFNGGVDGSRAVQTVEIDPTGKGKFQVAKNVVTKNGDAAPAAAGTQQLSLRLPAGTNCTGGKAGNLCLMSLKTQGGFGNCIVVQQGGAAVGNSKGAKDRRAVGTRAARAHLEADLE